MNPVLVLDGHLKSSLSTVRALGKAGRFVVCGASKKSAMALHSKYVQQKFVYTAPKENQSEFVADIQNQAQALFNEYGEKPIVFCFSDATHLSLARAYSQLQNVLLFPLPPHEPREVTFDKEKTYTFAQTLHIPTIACYQQEQFENVQYPAVVKPRHSIVWKDGRGVSGTAEFVSTQEELETTFHHIRTQTGESPLVQEYIEGDEYGVECVCKGGSILLQFAHKRIRSLSPRGGAAVVKETAPNTEEVALMKKYTATLLRELQWTGPAMVEFKIDNRDNSVRLMEINGRFWGSLPLAFVAGVDFAKVYCSLAEQAVLENSTDIQIAHKRTRHFLGDCKWLLSVFFAKDVMREKLYPRRTQALWDFIVEPFRSQADIFAFNDVMPSFWEYIAILKK